MTTNEGADMETITDPAAIRATDDPDERGDFRCCVTPSPVSGICRTCLLPIWNEGGTFGHVKRDEGWSDRIERGDDSIVCFSAAEYRHVPLDGREAAIYDRAHKRGRESAEAEVVTLRDTLSRRTDSHTQLVRDNDTLRAKVAAVGDVAAEVHVEADAEDQPHRRAALRYVVKRIDAALATTGEGQ